MSYPRSIISRDVATRQPVLVSPSAYSIESVKDFVAVKSKNTYFKRKKNRSVLIIILATLTAVLITAAIVLAVPKSRPCRGNNICDNENCARMAASLKESMDTSVNPCDDFYGYVCGRWTEEHYTSESGDSWFSERTRKMNWEIKELLKKNFTFGEVPLAVTKAKKLYDSCMDVESLNLLGLEPLLRTLNKVDLPQIPAALTGKRGNIVEIMAKVRRFLRKDVFVGVRVLTDPSNNTMNIAVLDVPDTRTLPYSYNAELENRMDVIRDRYEKLEDQLDGKSNSQITLTKNCMFEIIREIISNGTASNGSFKDEESVSRDRAIKEIVDIIINLSRTFYRISREEKNFVNFRINDLQWNTDMYVKNVNRNLVPRKIWRPYVTQLLGDVKEFDQKTDITIMGNLNYLNKVAYLLATTDEVELETLVWWEVVQFLVPHSSTNLKFLWEKYMSALKGYESSQSRPLYCADIATRMMGTAVSWLIVDPKFQKEKGTKIIEMFEDVRTAFSSIITSADWMDLETQRFNFEKAQKMTYAIGHPSWLFQEGMLDNYYEDIDTKEDKFLENILTIISLKSANELKRLFEYNARNDSNTWTTDPIYVNALHSFLANHITIPAGIIQFPFYDLGLEALNYGAIGTIIGHEVIHSYDDTSRHLDKDGNVGFWWSAKSVDRYNDKSECFVKQYSSYYVEEVNDYVDGKLTLEENIADNGGLSEALLAYEKWKSRNDQEPMLPGFTHLTHEQLLFVGFARVWCESNTVESLRRRFRDLQSPGYLRIKGVLQNSPEFSKAWKCPLGSEMNPEKKCKIW